MKKTKSRLSVLTILCLFSITAVIFALNTDVYSLDQESETEKQNWGSNGVSPIAIMQQTDGFVPLSSGFYFCALEIIPDELEVGESVKISVIVNNDGDETDTCTVVFIIDDIIRNNVNITTKAGSSEKVSIWIMMDDPGEYDVEVGDLSGSFTVKTVSSHSNGGASGGGGGSNNTPASTPTPSITPTPEPEATPSVTAPLGTSTPAGYPKETASPSPFETTQPLYVSKATITEPAVPDPTKGEAIKNTPPSSTTTGETMEYTPEKSAENPPDGPVSQKDKGVGTNNIVIVIVAALVILLAAGILVYRKYRKKI